MKYPFDEPYAGIESQLLDLPSGVPDSAAVRQIRELPTSAEHYALLGKALSRQLRYREAIEAYSAGLALEPENLSLLRLRAGRFLTTLQTDAAIRDFEACLRLGAEQVDCRYRIGLAHYYAGRYPEALAQWEACMPLCDDEMGIAVLYWHTLASTCGGKSAALLRQYHTGMAVGHHTAYEKAMRVWSGAADWQQMFWALEEETDDLEYGIVLYGLLWHRDCHDRKSMQQKLLCRDGFWPSFAYLAAWNDAQKSETAPA